MKHIYLNLKRFDIPPSMGGVNRLAPAREWGRVIVERIQDALWEYPNALFAAYLPEAHLLSALAAKHEESRLQIGCQGVYRMDTAPGGNFGAFTTNRTGNAMAAIGCESAIIGHCEERNDKQSMLVEAGVDSHAAGLAVNRILNQENSCAQQAGLSILYCIGEKAEERDHWQQVLRDQLAVGLQNIDLRNAVIAYEPVWAIGPGKMPPGREEIAAAARFIKEVTGGMPVVYGGGLKQDNADMLASIKEIDGGLIALTRFQGEIGFYPEEYLEIIRIYMQHCA